jgi:hypothetical protein
MKKRWEKFIKKMIEKYCGELQCIKEFSLYLLLSFYYYIIFIFYNCSLNLLTEI